MRERLPNWNQIPSNRVQALEYPGDKSKLADSQMTKTNILCALARTHADPVPYFVRSNKLPIVSRSGKGSHVSRKKRPIKIRDAFTEARKRAEIKPFIGL